MPNELIPKTKLLKLRQKASLTQLEMSRLLGVTENTYANWEKGRAGVRWIAMVVNLCKLFECEAINLIEYETKEIQENE